MWEVFNAILSLFSAIVLLFGVAIIVRMRGKWENISQAVEILSQEEGGFIEQIVSEWNEYVNNPETGKEIQQNLGENLQNFIIAPLADSLFTRFKGMYGGISKGFNSQLSALSEEVVADGIGQATGNPMMGELASGFISKYKKKYPELMMFLPMLLQNQGSLLGGGGQGGFNPPSGGPPTATDAKKYGYNL